MRVVRPVALRGVAWLTEYRVDPQHVVLLHGALGIMAAALIAIGGLPWLWIAAALLIGKVVLDNIDGGLARATGQVTRSGRYLDTLVDFVVNIALFWALASHGPGLAIPIAFLALTLVLSVDYNLERRYKEVRSSIREAEPADLPIGAPRGVYAALRTAYEVLFAPQDRLVETIDDWTYEAIAESASVPVLADARSRWNDLFSTAALVNLGLSTQMTVLAATLVAGRPYLYIWFVLLQAPYLLCVWLLRVWRFREYLRSQ